MFIKYIDKEADKTILTNEFGNKKEMSSKHVGLCWKNIWKRIDMKQRLDIIV